MPINFSRFDNDIKGRTPGHFFFTMGIIGIIVSLFVCMHGHVNSLNPPTYHEKQMTIHKTNINYNNNQNCHITTVIYKYDMGDEIYKCKPIIVDCGSNHEKVKIIADALYPKGYVRLTTMYVTGNDDGECLYEIPDKNAGIKNGIALFIFSSFWSVLIYFACEDNGNKN